MPTAIAKLESVSPYSQSRYLLEERRQNESWDDYEKRVWRERAHVVKSGPDAGKVFIPPMAFKQAIDSAARYASIQKKGAATWTKHFISGIICMDPLVLDVTRDDLDYFAGPMSSTGQKGKSGGSVVVRIYPMINEWRGELTLHVIDDEITESVFLRVLEIAGRNIGIGRFRPQNGGFNGRFRVESVRWLNE